MNIEANIQKWGNSLALRVSGALREIPGFEEGTPVFIEIKEDGFRVTKKDPDQNTLTQMQQRFNALFPHSETELIEGLSDQTGLETALSAAEIDTIWGDGDDYGDLCAKER